MKQAPASGALPDFSLAGSTALVTGASRGIGQGIANALSAAGARLVICSRKADDIERAAAQIRAQGGEALGVAANVSRAEDRRRLLEAALDWAGAIDILVNNAGANPSYGPLAEISEAAWDKVFSVNLKGPFLLCQGVFAAWMQEHGGAVLNISSLAGMLPTNNINAYSVTKAALNHLTRCLASEWGRFGVRVNGLAPGLIKTDFSRALWETPDIDKVMAGNPIARLGEVQDLVGAALLLVSPAANYITGQTWVIDGGERIASYR